MNNKTELDKIIALIFGFLTLIFIIIAFTNNSFFEWVFERHQNQLSWYIRPLFLIPFCFYAYKRSWAGIFGTIFFLLTSMFWFPKPEVVSEEVKQFLIMEKEYLTGNWNLTKGLISLLVPASLAILSAAFWKRNLWLGLSVLVFIAVAKMSWSVVFGGESGKSIFIPAVIGLIICVGLIYLGFKKFE